MKQNPVLIVKLVTDNNIKCLTKIIELSIYMSITNQTQI